VQHTETLVGFRTRPTFNSQPEHTAIDYKVGGLPLDPVPSTCNDSRGTRPPATPSQRRGVDNDVWAGPMRRTQNARPWADGTDQEVSTRFAFWTRTDNCPADWNPEQINTARCHATGDACDTDDDEDQGSPTSTSGSAGPPRNLLARYFDMTGDASVNVRTC